MTLIEPLKKIIRKVTGEKRESPSPEYSYRIFWTKQALSWTVEQRAQVKVEVEDIMRQDDFEVNEVIRRYRLNAYGGKKHAGASLLALHDVLSDLDRIEASGGLE